MILGLTLISIVAAFIGLYYLIVADVYDGRMARGSKFYDPDAKAKKVMSAFLLVIISVLALAAAYVG